MGKQLELDLGICNSKQNGNVPFVNELEKFYEVETII